MDEKLFRFKQNKNVHIYIYIRLYIYIHIHNLSSRYFNLASQHCVREIQTHLQPLYITTLMAIVDS
jgi:hypothetical protein